MTPRRSDSSETDPATTGGAGATSSTRVLIVYATTYGHTTDVVARLAERLAERGIDARVVRVRDARAIDVAPYDAVIAGGSIRASHHQRAVLDWLRDHRASVEPERLALFSVSLAACSPDAATVTREHLDELREAAGSERAMAVPIGGALSYRRYRWPTRLLMRSIARGKGLPTDTSTDHDLTDWDLVDALADAVADRCASVSV